VSGVQLLERVLASGFGRVRLYLPPQAVQQAKPGIGGRWPKAPGSVEILQKG